MARAFKRIIDGFKVGFALPVYQVVNLIKYAQTRQGRAAKIATFAVFAPILVFSLIMWAAFWIIAISLILWLVA